MLADIFFSIERPLVSLLLALLVLRFSISRQKLRIDSPLREFITIVTDRISSPLSYFFKKRLPLPWRYLLAAFLLALVESIFSALFLLPDPINAVWNLFHMHILSSVIRVVLVLLNTYIFILFLSAILSWINPAAPIGITLEGLSAPILNFIRRYVPLVGSIDISPLIAIIGLQVLQEILTRIAIFW